MRTAVSAVALILVFSLATAHAKEPKVGKLHPEVRLPTIDGKQTISLRSLAGKRVLLLQFASW